MSTAAPNPVTGNLLAEVPDRLEAEEFRTLLETGAVRIERIVSTGQATPPGSWYDQAWDEWVLLLAGRARLRLDGEAEDRALRPGDHLLIPARVRHRVVATSTEEPTVWLAVHVGGTTG